MAPETPVKTNAPKGTVSRAIDSQDYQALNDVLFEWADSYDAKDWARLRAIVAPTLFVDYTTIGKDKWPAMSAEDFLSMVSDPEFLGDPCVKTQHLIGASWWERVSETEVVGHHQLRAAHLVYKDPKTKEVKLRGHSHATNEHFYTKINGVWKFAGLRPLVRWNEHDFEKVFLGSYKSS